MNLEIGMFHGEGTDYSLLKKNNKNRTFVDVLCVRTKNIMQMWNWNVIAKAFALQMLIVCITLTI